MGLRSPKERDINHFAGPQRVQSYDYQKQSWESGSPAWMSPRVQLRMVGWSWSANTRCSHILGIVNKSLTIEFFWWLTSSMCLDEVHIDLLYKLKYFKNNLYCISPAFCDTAHMRNLKHATNQWLRHNKPTQTQKTKQRFPVERGSVGECGRHHPSGVREAQACAEQHGEQSQYFVITVNGK